MIQYCFHYSSFRTRMVYITLSLLFSVVWLSLCPGVYSYQLQQQQQQQQQQQARMLSTTATTTTSTTSTWPLPMFTLKFIVIDDALNLTETEMYLQSTLEDHLTLFLSQSQQPQQQQTITELVLQPLYLNRTFLGNESGIPVSLLRTDWDGVIEWDHWSIDDALLVEANKDGWEQLFYLAFQGDDLFDLLRVWGNHPTLKDVIAKVQVEDADRNVLDEASIADAFPPVNPPSRKDALFSKQTIIMTAIIMAVMSVLMVMCWWYQRRQRKLEEQRIRLEKREKWNKLKERRDRERAAKQIQPGTEEWMDEMTKSLTSIPVRDTNSMTSNSSRTSRSFHHPRLTRQVNNQQQQLQQQQHQQQLHNSSSSSSSNSSSLQRSHQDLRMQGSMDNLYAIPEWEEQSSQRSRSRDNHSFELYMEEENDDDEEEEENDPSLYHQVTPPQMKHAFVSHTVYL